MSSMCLRLVGRTWICRTQLCHLPSGGEQRVEIVVQGVAEVEFFGCFEQSELVERFAERGQDGLPRIPLAQDVVARLGCGCALGEVVGGVAFAFPIGQVGAGEHEMLAGSVWSVAAILAERAV